MSEKISIVAEYRLKNMDGDVEKFKLTSEGETAADALAALEAPKGINFLVNVTVTKGDKTFTRAIAPHKARMILSDKNEYEFRKAFNSL